MSLQILYICSLKSKTMKKTIAIISPIIFISVCIAYLMIGADYTVNAVIALLGISFLTGILFLLYIGLVNPGKILFKYRFWLFSILFGLFMASINLTTEYLNGEQTNLMKVVMGIVIFIFTSLLITVPIQYWGFKSLRKKTMLDIEEGETEVFTSGATITVEKKNIAGRIILTTKRLCFISSGLDKIRLEYNLMELKSGVELTKTKYLGITSGISLPDKDTKIYLAFCQFWKKEINKVIS